MNNLDLRQDTIDAVKHEIVGMVKEGMKDDLDTILLYGSCARGDYSNDSDIDIALLTNCDRMESKKYTDLLAGIATKMALKYFAVINFVCLPKSLRKKSKLIQTKERLSKNSRLLFRLHHLRFFP